MSAPPPPSVSVVGGAATVRVIGGYEAAACGPPGGIAQRDGSLLRLEIEPTVTSPPCDAARVAYDYDATLTGLEPGKYTLEVYHRVDPTAERRLVHSTVVTVQ
jgi:hypothetical protein